MDCTLTYPDTYLLWEEVHAIMSHLPNIPIDGCIKADAWVRKGFLYVTMQVETDMDVVLDRLRQTLLQIITRRLPPCHTGFSNNKLAVVLMFHMEWPNPSGCTPQQLIYVPNDVPIEERSFSYIQAWGPIEWDHVKIPQ